MDNHDAPEEIRPNCQEETNRALPQGNRILYDDIDHEERENSDVKDQGAEDVAR